MLCAADSRVCRTMHPLLHHFWVSESMKHPHSPIPWWIMQVQCMWEVITKTWMEARSGSVYLLAMLPEPLIWNQCSIYLLPPSYTAWKNSQPEEVFRKGLSLTMLRPSRQPLRQLKQCETMKIKGIIWWIWELTGISILRKPPGGEVWVVDKVNQVMPS